MAFRGPLSPAPGGNAAAKRGERHGDLIRSFLQGRMSSCWEGIP